MITVLMAAKTSTEYMPQAVGSLMGQSYQDWQLIVGVNGIPDDPALGRDCWSFTEQRIYNAVHRAALASTFPIRSRSVVLNLPQCRNKAEALNEMMQHAEGDLVAILDVDDLWHPLKLERQASFLQATDLDVLGTRGGYFGEAQQDIGVPDGYVALAMLRRNNCLLNSSVVMRRELARWEPMDEPLEDYELWLRLAADNHRIYNHTQYLTFIRQHGRKWSAQSDHSTALQVLRSRYA